MRTRDKLAQQSGNLTAESSAALRGQVTRGVAHFFWYSSQLHLFEKRLVGGAYRNHCNKVSSSLPYLSGD
jgi:hypothetical protein